MEVIKLYFPKFLNVFSFFERATHFLLYGYFFPSVVFSLALSVLGGRGEDSNSLSRRLSHVCVLGQRLLLFLRPELALQPPAPTAATAAAPGPLKPFKRRMPC